MPGGPLLSLIASGVSGQNFGNFTSGWYVLAGALVVVGGALQSFSKYRKNAMKSLEESNKALRQLKGDLDERVEALEKDVAERDRRITSQQAQIETLERAVSRIESLNALQTYLDGRFNTLETAIAALP